MLSEWFTLPFPVTFCIHCRALCKQTHWPFCFGDSFMDSRKEAYVYVYLHTYVYVCLRTKICDCHNSERNVHQKLPNLKL